MSQAGNIKYLTRSALALGLASLSLSSCEKLDQDVAPRNAATIGANAGQLVAGTTDAANSYFASMAATIARIINTNPKAKQVLEQLASQQFDGDYDVAYQTLLRADVGGQSFGDLLHNEGFQTDPLAAGLSQEQANRIIVAIPVFIENWNSMPVLQATYIPVGVPDSELKTVPTYDGLGHTAEFTADLKPLQESFVNQEMRLEEQPSTPFVVVSLGERLDESGAVRQEFTPLYKQRLKQQQEALMQTSARGGGREEYLRGIKCDRLGEYEPAIRGQPEFRLYAASSYNNSFSTSSPVVVPYKIMDGILFTGSRSTFDYGFDPNMLLFRWNTNFSDFYTMRWIEEDGGPTIKLTLDASYTKGGIKFGGSTTIDFSHWEDDDYVGEQAINIQDANWRYYIYSYYGSNPLFLTTMESR
ncbi:hypothetical protein [Hymenobacter persicinus]|uniref:Uncharacterized protein n=1 Tax=Hymenobacter persicinus TaxID=2025506 RepID=A0A4V1ZAV2_9BACT|nr:hypothetical protein [Hymenobacter persicinus]RYU80286.1 hypothetical protein EWM57_08870 [Hymenobacter persicinus]